MKTSSVLGLLGAQALYMLSTLFVIAPAYANDKTVPKNQLSQIESRVARPNEKIETGSIRPILDFKKFFESKDPDKRLKLQAGPRTGGGGNSCALGIVRNTEALIYALEAMPFLHSKPEMNLIKEKANSARYYQAKILTLNGESKDAINYSNYGMIYVTEAFCGKLESIVNGTTLALLYHEILGLAKIDDTNYQKSTEFLKDYNNEDTRIREGSSVFGYFAGDVPAEPIRNVKDIKVKRARCAKQAEAIAKVMTVALGEKTAKIFSIQSSEQYDPAGDQFLKVETYYFDEDIKLSVVMLVEECVFLSLNRVFED